MHEVLRSGGIDEAAVREDGAARRQALDPAGSFLVQAPAGSGKTELLTDRLLALLAVVERPEEILAITFTRKAAAEMHARVLEKLRAADAPEPLEEYRRHSWRLAREARARDEARGWQLLQYPARLGIRTIDAFCAHLAGSLPWTSALGGMPGIVDDAAAHYQAAAGAVLAMADDEPAVAALLAHLDVDLRAAQELLAGMLARRDQWLPLLASGDDLGALERNLGQALRRDLRRLCRAMPLGWAEALAPPARVAAEVLGGAQGPLAVLQDWTGVPFGADPADLPAWRALATLLLTGEGALRRRVDKRQGFEAKTAAKEQWQAWLEQADPDAAWVAALAEARELPDARYTPAQRETLEAVLHCLRLAAAQLQLSFHEAGEVDFIEIAQRAARALGDADAPSDRLLALDASIRHILVDEFQDTSQVQIDLLARLTAGWSPGDGRSLFLVGDPMQSIYRFRKAEVGWFLRVQAEGLHGLPVQPLALARNFRSQAALVDWVNQACGDFFPGRRSADVEDDDLGAVHYTPSVASRPAVAGLGVQVHAIVAPEDEADEADDWMAAQQRALIVDLARRSLGSQAQPRTVALLVRARSHLEGAVHALSAAGIACRAVELVSLQERPVVVDLAQLARALSHAGDRLAWLSVLRSPLCGLTLTSLHALFGNDHQQAAPVRLARWLVADAAPEQDDRDGLRLPASEARRLRRAASILLDDGNASGAMPFAAWLAQVWQRLGGPSIYQAPGDAEDAERLLRLVETLAPYGRLNPAMLESRLEGLYAAPREGQGPVVEVMTIHKSKGLEFDTVILAGLHRVARADTPPLMQFEQQGDALLLGPIKPRASSAPDPVSAYLMRRERRRAAYEADRLLYVALTRARDALHVVARLGRDRNGAVRPPSASSLLGRLWGSLGELAAQPPDGQPLADSRSGGVAAIAGGLRRPTDAWVAGQDDARGAAQPGRPALPWAWSEDRREDRLAGIVAHAWLEQMGREGLQAWTADRVAACLPRLRLQLRRAGLSGEALEEAAGAVAETLRATLGSERGRWLLGVAGASREWTLLDLDGRVSVIDLAISRQADWLVVDYKTGVPGPQEPPPVFAERMLARYRDQLARYCQQVSAIDGRPAQGVLYFPRADLWLPLQAHG